MQDAKRKISGEDRLHYLEKLLEIRLQRIEILNATITGLTNTVELERRNRENTNQRSRVSTPIFTTIIGATPG